MSKLIYGDFYGWFWTGSGYGITQAQATVLWFVSGKKNWFWKVIAGEKDEK